MHLKISIIRDMFHQNGVLSSIILMKIIKRHLLKARYHEHSQLNLKHHFISAKAFSVRHWKFPGPARGAKAPGALRRLPYGLGIFQGLREALRLLRRRLPCRADKFLSTLMFFKQLLMLKFDSLSLQNIPTDFSCSPLDISWNSQQKKKTQLERWAYQQRLQGVARLPTRLGLCLIFEKYRTNTTERKYGLRLSSDQPRRER